MKLSTNLNLRMLFVRITFFSLTTVIVGCKKDTQQTTPIPVNYINLTYHVKSDAGIILYGSTYRTTAPNEPFNGAQVDIGNDICTGGCGNESQGTFKAISGHYYWFNVKTNYLGGGIQPHNSITITYNGDTIAGAFSGCNDCSQNPGTHVYYCCTVVGTAP